MTDFRGLHRKYKVVRLYDPEAKHNGCEYFVLDLTHDRHAIVAIAAYAEAVKADRPNLSADLRALAEGGAQ